MLNIKSTDLTFALLGALTLVACGEDEREPYVEPPITHTVDFVGYAYDGATGARLTGYTIDAQIASVLIDGTIDEEGRYVLAGLSAWADFTVRIDGGAYRVFRSHNAKIGLPLELDQSDAIAGISTHQTRHFDAYLFPSDLLAPAVTFTVNGVITTQLVSGTMRLRPVAPSVLNDGTLETPTGVPGQLWTNDEDLQAEVLTIPISNGEITLAAGDLIYGVTYQVNIYDVNDHRPFEGSYQAGIESDKTFQLAEKAGEPLVVTGDTIALCTPPSTPTATSGAEWTVQFNQPVEFHPTTYPGGEAELLDDQLFISSSDFDVDLVRNILRTDLTDSVQEHGVSAVISGDTLTVSWNPSVGLATNDPDDPITSVSYSGLSNIEVRRINAPSSARALSSLLLLSTVTCN